MVIITDASLFSRALTTIDIKKIEKYLDKTEQVVYVGKATSVSGDLIRYARAKYVTSPNLLGNGNKIEESKEQSGSSVYKYYNVAPGLTFEELLTELKPSGFVPVLLPFYLKGTVGGFISSNGSGFGSYKFGFVRGKKEVHKLVGSNVATIMTAKYPEVIEVDTETEYAWSAVIVDGKERCYLPSFYAKFLGISRGGNVDSYTLLSDFSSQIVRSFKRDYFPLILLYPPTSRNKIFSIPNYEEVLTYIINYNSPEKYYVTIGNAKFNDLEKISEFLLKNKDVKPFPSPREYTTLELTILKEIGKKVKTPKQYSKISKLYVDSLKCINCGLCLDVCLAYKITGNPVFSPMARIGRLIFEETSFETCFGCTKDEEICPVNIPISELMTEGVNKVSPTTRPPIEISDVTADIRALEKKLNEKYRNRPLFFLFVGCAAKYDPIGLRGFLQFLLDNGDKLPARFSPKVRLISGRCCGFDDYLAGDDEGARKKVMSIIEEKNNSGAINVYFMCPEGLYVYNKFSDQKGILAYEVIKDQVQGKIHTGCWAKKLGIKGDDDECAGLTFTTYQGFPFPYSKKQVATICPFSTWKFGTLSVYGQLYKENVIQQTEVAENAADAEKEILDLALVSIKDALIQSVDEIAEKVGLWSLGGEQYFITITFPILSKHFSDTYKSNLKASDKKDLIVKYLNSIINDPIMLESKLTLVVDYLKSQNYEDVVSDAQSKIVTSPRLEFSMADIAKSEEMKKALREIIRRAISTKTIERIFKDVLYS
ncbi:MAG: 4Fe-4S dicluster domain-containing protein [Sulfolobaceae archaeon]